MGKSLVSCFLDSRCFKVFTNNFSKINDKFIVNFD